MMTHTVTLGTNSTSWPCWKQHRASVRSMHHTLYTGAAYVDVLCSYFSLLLGATEHHRHRCLILPLYSMTLGDVLHNNSLRPLPLRHIREIAFQIIRGVSGNMPYFSIPTAVLIRASQSSTGMDSSILTSNPITLSWLMIGSSWRPKWITMVSGCRRYVVRVTVI